MSNVSNIGAGKSVVSSSFTYHVEMEKGHVGAEFPSIEQAIEGHTDGEQSVKVLADWQAAESPATPGTQTATITFHDRPCGVMVRVPVQPSAQHTPGPWYITARSDKRSPLRIRSNDNLPGAVEGPLVATIAEAQGVSIACANARLIASAPELLELIKKAAEIMPLGSKTRGEWLILATKALIKAEGAK